jgi:hypothetical protein
MMDLGWTRKNINDLEEVAHGGIDGCGRTIGLTMEMSPMMWTNIPNPNGGHTIELDFLVSAARFPSSLPIPFLITIGFLPFLTCFLLSFVDWRDHDILSPVRNGVLSKPNQQIF